MSYTRLDNGMYVSVYSPGGVSRGIYLSQASLDEASPGMYSHLASPDGASCEIYLLPTSLQRTPDVDLMLV